MQRSQTLSPGSHTRTHAKEPGEANSVRYIAGDPSGKNRPQDDSAGSKLSRPTLMNSSKTANRTMGFGSTTFSFAASEMLGLPALCVLRPRQLESQSWNVFRHKRAYLRLRRSGKAKKQA